ncbi:MAG TPA: alanine dehydrogenase [Saprospiraceae bacterium]|nr:alanine dehydrogenase [Saprospiraceae bacterium]
MSDKKKKIPIPKIFTERQMHTQTEMLQVQRKSRKLFIGIPKETTLQENRVALVPASVATLVAHGHRVVVEKDAGIKSNYSDHVYSEVGADIAYSQEQVYKSDILLKVAPPTLDEIDLLHPNQVLISPLQIPIISSEYINKLRQKRVISLAMEYIKDEVGTFPIVRIMSEMAGISAMLTAAELLSTTSGGKGVLLGGISGVPSAKVVILGAGVVAEFATRTALGLGADIRIFDNNVYKLMRLQNVVGRQLNTSTLNPLQLKKELLTADVVIGAMHSQAGRTPIVVSEEIVAKMKTGSVIIDVSIDQGGCFATSEVTSHKNPTIVRHGVIHYCVPNIASKISRTASIAVSNILLPILLKAATTGGIEQLLLSDYGLRHGVYTYKGCLTNQYLGERFQIKSTDLDLLITSSL